MNNDVYRCLSGRSLGCNVKVAWLMVATCVFELENVAPRCFMSRSFSALAFRGKKVRQPPAANFSMHFDEALDGAMSSTYMIKRICLIQRTKYGRKILLPT